MTEVAITSTLKDIQHNWPLIARDLAMFTRPQAGATATSIAEIAMFYNLSMVDLRELLQLPLFKKYLKQELERIKDLGTAAGYVMHAEVITAKLDEKLLGAALTGALELPEVLKFRNAMAKSAGIDAPLQHKEAAAGQNNTQVNIKLDIPRLENPKLAHMYEVLE